jgi:hypothetical protein
MPPTLEAQAALQQYGARNTETCAQVRETRTLLSVLAVLIAVVTAKSGICSSSEYSSQSDVAWWQWMFACIGSASSSTSKLRLRLFVPITCAHDSVTLALLTVS